jgi:hypothetical protein
LTTTTFRRAFVLRSERVAVEVAPGEVWALPNPTPEGRRYDPAAVLRRVIEAGEVDLARWARAQEFED